MNNVSYLGRKCTDKGILPDSSKYEIIKNYHQPSNKDEDRRLDAL